MDGPDEHIACAQVATSINDCWTRLGSDVGLGLNLHIIIGVVVADWGGWVIEEPSSIHLNIVSWGKSKESSSLRELMSGRLVARAFPRAALVTIKGAFLLMAVVGRQEPSRLVNG